MSTINYLLVAFSPPGMLYVLSIISGLCFGAHWSLLPCLSSELFGLENFASIYTILQLSPAAWGFGLGAWLVGNLYEKAGDRHQDPLNTCYGSDCFSGAFSIISLCSMFSCILSCWLTARSLRLYRAEYGALRIFERDIEDTESLL